MARQELLRLLQACEQATEVDAVRLVLADWLEENGDEADRDRAEAIRLQLAEESVGGHMHHRQRVHSLLVKHLDAWLGPLAGVDQAWLDRGLWRQPWPAPLARTASATFRWPAGAASSRKQAARRWRGERAGPTGQPVRLSGSSPGRRTLRPAS